MNRVLSALVVLALVGLPASAAAQQPQTNAPPGNSAIDEYLETVPGATGSQLPKPPSNGGGDGSTSATLTPAQRRQLESQGADGKALADAVERTSPGAAPSERQPEQLASGKGRSPISEAFDAATGTDGGMGLVLPAILIATLLGFIALIALRRRSVS